MDQEKRKGMKPVPDNIEEVLNIAQIRTLHSMRRFGWELQFVRRPLFQETLAVLINQEGDKIMVLEADGSTNDMPELDTRESLSAQELINKKTG